MGSCREALRGQSVDSAPGLPSVVLRWLLFRGSSWSQGTLVTTSVSEPTSFSVSDPSLFGISTDSMSCLDTGRVPPFPCILWETVKHPVRELGEMFPGNRQAHQRLRTWVLLDGVSVFG